MGGGKETGFVARILTSEAAWIQQNKRKLFLGRFASRNLQRAYESVTTEAERGTLAFKDLVSKLTEHFKTGSNTTLALANFEFRKLSQRDDESFDSFAIRVKHDSRKCDFSCESADCSVRDTLARDQIITGVISDEIRKHALKNQWGLEELIKNGRQIEAASAGVEQIKSSSKRSSPGSVRRIKKPGKYSRKSPKDSSERPTAPNNCTTCSSRACPGGKKCPGTKVECFECRKKGHFKGSQACQKKQKKSIKPSRRVESDDDDESDRSSEQSGTESSDESSGEEPKRTFRFRSMRNVTKIRRMRVKKAARRAPKSKRYEVEIVIKEKPVRAFADTGADICIMSKRQAKALGLKLMKTRMSIRPYGSDKMKCCGYSVVTVMYGDRVANIEIYVINKSVETLLSGPVAEELGIITFNGNSQAESCEEGAAVGRVVEETDPLKRLIKQNYPNLSSGRVGKLHDYQVKYHVDETVPPAVDAKRPIAYHLQERFEREIESMIQDGVCSEHHGPAPWISNPVLCPKPDGGMRITVDMANPNKAIKQTNIPIPRVEDIKARLAGNKVFSKLDFKSAFFQLELDESSKILTVFYAGNRLLRLNRVVQGCCPSSGELSKALAPLFQSIPEVHLIQDDLILATKNQRDHRRALEKVLEIIETSGMTLNLSKCLFEKDEIPFWGLIVSKDGLRPDPKKVESLREASAPSNKAELSSFLCMIQSNRDFIPRLASKTLHMRKRLKKNCRFTWDKHCQREFEDLKSSFTEACLLHHFDPSINTFICVDAHSSGLSAILMQGECVADAKPIAFASRTTTDAECRYPQLDLEALSVDFGLRRFRYYVVGAPCVKIVTDHKPLVSIFANKRKGSIRTDRIKLRHQDIRYEVVWRKGSDNPSDYLSRHATPLKNLPTAVQNESNELEKTIWYLHFGPYVEAISMEKIICKTQSDSSLQKLSRFIRKGYAPAASDDTLASFRKVFDHLTISDDGLIMKGEKIVLPTALHQIAIKKAHQGAHPGMSGMKRRLRSHFWFPKMDTLIEEFVSNCQECQMFTNKHSKHHSSLQPKEGLGQRFDRSVRSHA